MQYNFDAVINRENNFSAKYDELGKKFGRDDLTALWVADMDFMSAKPIIDAIKDRAEQGIYGYTSRPDSYYEAFCEWYRKRHGFNIKKEWIIHSPAVVSSLSLIVREVTQPGDKIIIQTPVYHPFFEVVEKNNRKLVKNPLKKVNGIYVIDYEDLEKKVIDEKVKFLILCNPHNPGGRVWTKEELIRLGEICIKNNVKVISDEIHGELVFGGKRYTPFASISEEFCKHSITCLSATKTFNIAGLQASFVVIPNKCEYDKVDEILGILDIRRNNCFSLVAVEAAYKYGEEWLEQLLDYIEKNIEYVINYCKERIPKIKINKPDGTYLLWLDCKELGMEDDELSSFFINQAEVALNSGIGFGDDGKDYMRMNVACPRSILEEALKKIEGAVNKLEK
ncbi:MalY/PatB family protein [Crassaminicella profunda]|uniref:MalY/PatB family protein n=1 Tax=Crassaminicella profunda TaxID=1286698 RepID=UPI001CA61B08|nr:MalY/PatB family protein [Crassaminicella profunda]QZY56262.1 pyridoxal phosphate-dependent aminotransferase [Crassaminicella profunda]